MPIIVIICLVITIVSMDFCIMISNFKKEKSSKNQVAQFPEKINFTNERPNNKRAHILNIDQRVLHFELKKQPKP